MSEPKFYLCSSKAELVLEIFPNKPYQTENDRVFVNVAGEEELSVKIYNLIKEHLKEKSSNE